MPAAENARLIARARELLQQARSVAVLTGAGISAESGIPTFRGPGGLWAEFSVEDVATAEAFRRDPARVWKWHNERRTQLRQVRPSPAHFALAELERTVRARGGRFLLATQNIDGLHQAAGSRSVLELHGSLTAARCTTCDYHEHIESDPIEPVPACPRCGKPLRPDVVWFGESFPQGAWLAAADAARECDAYLSAGTSATVYPAAGLIEDAVRAGASDLVDIALHGKAGDILPQIVS